MRRAVLAVLAAATMASAALPGTASAAPDPTGFTCGFTSVEDPASDGWSVGEMEAALVLTDDADPLLLRAGSVTCEVVLDGVSQQVTGPVATGVAVVAGTVHIPPGTWNIEYCTRVNYVDGTVRYWDDVESRWVGTRTCWQPITVEPEPVDPSLRDLDPFLCPLLAVAAPPEGDLPVWDCPPYS